MFFVKFVQTKDLFWSLAGKCLQLRNLRVSYPISVSYTLPRPVTASARRGRARRTAGLCTGLAPEPDSIMKGFGNSFATPRGDLQRPPPKHALPH